VAKGLKVPCLFMITEVSIRCQKNPGGWYTPYTRVYPPIHHCLEVTVKVRGIHVVGPEEEKERLLWLLFLYARISYVYVGMLK